MDKRHYVFIKVHFFYFVKIKKDIDIMFTKIIFHPKTTSVIFSTSWNHGYIWLLISKCWILLFLCVSTSCHMIFSNATNQNQWYLKLNVWSYKKLMNFLGFNFTNCGCILHANCCHIVAKFEEITEVISYCLFFLHY